MTSASFTASRTSRATPGVYLFHPAIDLFMVCGGWLLLLTAINYGLNGGRVQPDEIPPAMRVAALIGTYLLAQPHSVATLYKLYGDAAERKKHTYVSFVIPTLLMVALFVALKVSQLARLEASLYIGLALHHIMAQSYGVSLMYCHRAGMRPSGSERRLLQIILWTSVAAAVSQQFSTKWIRHAFLGIDLYQFDFIPPGLADGFQIAAGLSMLALFFLQGKRRAAGRQTMPLPSLMTMTTTVALLTIWDKAGELVWIFVPAFFHGSQYICVTMSYFIKKEKAAVKNPDKAALREFVAIRFTEMFIVALILFVGIPRLAATLRVNNLANLEALLNITASSGEIVGLLWGAYLVITGVGAGIKPSNSVESEGEIVAVKTVSSNGPIRRVTVGFFIAAAGLSAPGVINWLLASARDATLCN